MSPWHELYAVGDPVEVCVSGNWFRGHVQSSLADGRPVVSVDNVDLKSAFPVLSTATELMVEVEKESDIRKSSSISAEKAVKRQLAKGEKQDSSIEEDAQRIAAAVERHWGTHSSDVLRRAAQIAEESERQ